jgi:hypothetical protein
MLNQTRDKLREAPLDHHGWMHQVFKLSSAETASKLHKTQIQNLDKYCLNLQIAFAPQDVEKSEGNSISANTLSSRSLKEWTKQLNASDLQALILSISEGVVILSHEEVRY